VNRYLLPADLSLDVHGVVDDEVLRRIGGAARGAMSLRFNEIIRGAAMAGIRQRHPDYDSEKVRRAFFRLRLGDELMRTIWPSDELVEP
jgi:hypothetical protein